MAIERRTLRAGDALPSVRSLAQAVIALVPLLSPRPISGLVTAGRLSARRGSAYRVADARALSPNLSPVWSAPSSECRLVIIGCVCGSFCSRPKRGAAGFQVSGSMKVVCNTPCVHSAASLGRVLGVWSSFWYGLVTGTSCSFFATVFCPS
jgi:hypothetical protein